MSLVPLDGQFGAIAKRPTRFLNLNLSVGGYNLARTNVGNCRQERMARLLTPWERNFGAAIDFGKKAVSVNSTLSDLCVDFGSELLEVGPGD